MGKSTNSDFCLGLPAVLEDSKLSSLLEGHNFNENVSCPNVITVKSENRQRSTM